MSSITIDRTGFIANILHAQKAPCRVASTGNLTLSGEQTIDGVTVEAEDRVLVKDQTNGLNAIYVCKTSDWELAHDFDQRGHVVQGTWCFVVSGTVNAQTTWYVTTSGRPRPGRETINFAALGLNSANLGAIAGLTPSDGTIIAGDGSTWVAESGATARTSLGLGTGNTPEFTGLELGHATDTTLARSAAGRATIEGNEILTARANQFADLTEKTAPVIADLLLLEDSAASGAKKKIQFTNLSGLLTSGTISNASSLDIVLTSYTAYRAIRFVLTGWVPQTDNVVLYCRTSTNGGSSYDAGASDYAWAESYLQPTTSGTGGDAADSEIELGGSLGSSTGESLNIEVTLYHQTNTTVYKLVEAVSAKVDATGVATRAAHVGARLSASDVDAIRFILSSGNIASGSYAVYGLL